MIRALLLGCLLLLSACSGRPPLPEQTPNLALPMQLHVVRLQAGQRQDWLLVIQAEDGGLRWSMMDFLGIPQARQRLIDGKWQADGLLPPNPQARELFGALLFAFTEPARLPASYPKAEQQGNQRHLGERWQVTYRGPQDFTVQLSQGLSYQVSPLPDEVSP
ncbi:hypothetical protein [Pseudomonas abieticivorans]|uniref:hypothetical protein n=1 Tax=Pseudomonas abieticivorans TaxID=2931382 RepID=UPI0020BF2F89|nr:hypothetical protein [Pseudomonas sp. PIA16]